MTANSKRYSFASTNSNEKQIENIVFYSTGAAFCCKDRILASDESLRQMRVFEKSTFAVAPKEFLQNLYSRGGAVSTFETECLANPEDASKRP